MNTYRTRTGVRSPSHFIVDNLKKIPFYQSNFRVIDVYILGLKEAQPQCWNVSACAVIARRFRRNSCSYFRRSCSYFRSVDGAVMFARFNYHEARLKINKCWIISL